MTVKVGDKVRIVKCKDDLTKDGEYNVIEVDFGIPAVIDDVGDKHFLRSPYYTTVTRCSRPISTQIRDRMEYHMSKGEYVRAVKWAQIAEQVKELEDEY